MMNNLNNKVDSHRPCGFDSKDSPQGVQRRIMQIDLENSPAITRGDHTGVVRNGPKDLGHYEVYIVSRSLEGGLGVALIDTGSQVSLVKSVKYRQEKGKNLHLSGISGNQIEIKGKVQLEIENTLEPKKSNVLCC
jgi:hypothetical protein